MRICFLSVVFLCQVATALAQQLTGSIRDSTTREALPRATLIAKSTRGKTLAFTVADNDGRYALNLPIPLPDSLRLEIRFLGFETKAQVVAVSDLIEGKKYDFLLVPSTTALQEVEIEGRPPPIAVQGDTTRYDVERFRDSTEVTLGDLLGQLPGVEVSEEGNISVNGKRIDRLLIEGREFFGNNQRLATQNINAKMIGAVSVYRNYEEDKVARQFGKGDLAVMDIGIKDEYKGRITGNVGIGGGQTQKYNAQTTLLRFTQKSQSALIGRSNNTGERLLTYTDYQSLMGANALNGRLSNLIFSGNQNASRAGEMIALNYSLYPSEAWQIQSHAVVSRNEQDNQQVRQTRFLSTSDTLPLNLTQNDGRERLLFATLSLKIAHSPTDKRLTRYHLQLNGDTQKARENIQNSFGETSQSFAQNDGQEQIGISQDLQHSQLLGERTLWKANIKHQLNRQNNDRLLGSDTSFLGIPITMDRLEVLQKQQLNQDKYYFSTELNRRVFGFSVNANMSSALVHDRFQTAIIDFSGASVDLRQYDHRLGLRLKKESDRLSYEVFLTGLRLDLHTQDDHVGRWGIWPGFGLKANLPLGIFQTRYEITNSWATASDLQESPQIQSFQGITEGGIPLDFFQTQHRLFFNYLLLHALSGTMLNANLVFTRSLEVITRSSAPTPSYTRTIPILGEQEQRWIGSLKWTQVWGLSPFSTDVQLNYLQAEMPTFVGTSASSLEMQKIGGVVYFKSAFQESPINFRIGLTVERQRNRFAFTDNDVRLLAFAPALRLRGKFGKSWVWTADLTQQNFNSQTEERQLWKADFALRYRPKRKFWHLALRGDNILNLSSPQQVNVSANEQWTRTTAINVLPGFVVLEVVWQW